jgi:hypothetical protein
MMQDTRDLTLWQKERGGIISLFVNDLISGPITHAAYSVGNTTFALFKAVPLTLAEATIDTVRAGLGGAPIDRVYYGEVGAQLMGMYRGGLNGFVPGWKAFKSGISYMEGAERLGQDAGGRGAMLPGTSPLGEAALRSSQIGPALQALGTPERFATPIGRFLETPSRAVAMIHTVFYAMNYERNITRLAYRAAANEGLLGDAFQTRIAALRQKPSMEMVQVAHDDALASVLMKRPVYGSAQQKFVSAANGWLPAKLAMPFMQIGLNILDEGLVKTSPLGPLLSQTVRDNLFGRNGEVARTQQYARIMVGSGIMAGAMGLAAEGILTGPGPSNPRERMLLEATGWKADSIRVGNHYVPYRKYLGPLGPLVSGSVAIHDVSHLVLEGELGKAVGLGALGFSEVVADETWMSGLSNFIEATTHWDTAGERYVRNLALDFIPFSVGLGQTARMVDPYNREIHSWTAAFLNKLPGLSQQVYPQRDWTGTPIVGHTYMSPSTARPDRTMAAMDAAEFYPAKIRRDVVGVPLTDRQYDDLAWMAGHLAKTRMDALVWQPGFTALPAGIQQKQMAQTLERARKDAEDWLVMRPGNQNILRQANAAKAAQMQGRLPADVRAIRQGTTP